MTVFPPAVPASSTQTPLSPCRPGGTISGILYANAAADKPLVCCDYSINFGPDGKDHYPIMGAPGFLAGNQSIKLKVALKPGWHYSFTLTDLSFASSDGFPLQPYIIDFDTKTLIVADSHWVWIVA